MKNRAGIIGILFIFVLAAGCAQPITKPRARPADRYISKAQELEAKGDLVEALEQYKLALTVDPKNQAAKEKSDQIESTLSDLAEKHFQKGLAFHKRGEYGNARQEFLTALRYNADHLEAKRMLTEHEIKEQRVKGYLLHTIQQDESISMLAQKYYGDYRKFRIIAEYNQLENATKITVGQKIKVPVVEGMPFFARPEEIISLSREISEPSPTEVVPVKSFIIHTVQPDESLSMLAQRYYGDYTKFPIIARYNQLDETAGLTVGQKIKVPEIEGLPFIAKSVEEGEREAEIPVTTTAIREPPKVEMEAEKPVSPEDQIASYRELGVEFFNEKNYPSAIIEFNKVLSVNPDDEAALEYISLAYFEQGKSLLEKEEYTQAIEKFETALRYNAKCSECHDYISTSHFQLGLILFGKEDYLTSRDEFKASLQYNKDCEKCEEYIKKSEETYMDLHYNRGLSYFRDEKLAEALHEWELVYKIDPEYKDVASNLNKTRKLLERLESIKRSKGEDKKQ